MKNIFKDLKRRDHKRYLGGLDVFKYIGPGLLVTVGFIDPGNWASNFAAGSEFGYSLLWVVTLSTIMLIVLQHNVAHLGIVTGLCLSEAATKYTPSWVSRPILGTAVLASISTSLAEILGGAIALQMLFDIPIIWGSILTTVFVVVMLFTNSYKKIERSIIAFVSVIGLSFIYELFLVKIDWPLAAQGWVTPSFPHGSMLIIMSVLGAVVMPHNLFLHSEVIQSHEYNKKDDASIRKVLKYELFDTLFSMIVGWAINSAMILLAAATFFKSGIQVEELQQAKSLLEPLLGSSAAVVFALALLMAGISSTITSGMAVAVSEFLKGNISVAGTLCIVLLASEFFLPLRLLGSFFHIAMNGMAASDKIFKILDLPEPQAGEKTLPDGALDVTLKDVHFSYEEDREILKGIGLNLPAGSFVSLVGESGCGKSTIAGILAAKNQIGRASCRERV